MDGLDWRTLLIGAILSIPLSIIAGLLTAPAGRWVNRRIDGYRSRSRAATEAEQELVDFYVANPTRFTMSLVMRGATVVTIAIFATSYTILVAITSIQTPDTGPMEIVGWAAAFSALAMFQWRVIRLLRLYRRVTQAIDRDLDPPGPNAPPRRPRPGPTPPDAVTPPSPEPTRTTRRTG